MHDESIKQLNNMREIAVGDVLTPQQHPSIHGLFRVDEIIRGNIRGVDNRIAYYLLEKGDRTRSITVLLPPDSDCTVVAIRWVDDGNSKIMWE